jgi:hypothetical protein
VFISVAVDPLRPLPFGKRSMCFTIHHLWNKYKM